MRVAVLSLCAVIVVIGCAGLETPRVPLDDLMQFNGSFNEQYDELADTWNNLTRLHTVETMGFRIFIDGKLTPVNLSCSNKMAPTFGCADLLFEYLPMEERELKAGDVVSFEIAGSEAAIFTEEPFNGTRIIQRRIYRIDNTTGALVMKRDSIETTHKTFVPFSRVRGKVVAYVFDAHLITNPLPPFAGGRNVLAFNGLVEQWNTFVSSVYAARIQGQFLLFYDRNISVPTLACTGSMRPTVDCDDVIFSHRPSAQTDLAAGDVISFRIAPNETSGFLEPATRSTIHIMHRIFRLTTTSQGETAFITKGDNPETNAQTDAIYLPFDRVEGKVVAFFKDSFNATFGD